MERMLMGPVLMAGLMLVGTRDAWGQGETQPLVMHTGSGNVLLSQSVPYVSELGEAGSWVSFTFGFATREQAQPGFFADSFSISLTGPGGDLYLVTTDAHGVQWAPVVPGAIPTSETAIQHQTTAFLVPAGSLTPIAAYRVSFQIPQAWQARPLTFHFDLFDNQDLLESFAYYDVPEPDAAGLVLLGLALWRGCRRKS